MWSRINNDEATPYYRTMVASEALETYGISSDRDLIIVSNGMLDENLKKNVVKMFDRNKNNLIDDLTGWFKKSDLYAIYFVDQKV